jgi:metal-responsive CopG/Arc/MetJ family transcriptional regulator
MKVFIDIPETDLKRLDTLAKRRGHSRSALIRGAVKSVLGKGDKSWIEEGKGLWGDQNGDGLVEQEKLRAEWDR